MRIVSTIFRRRPVLRSLDELGANAKLHLMEELQELRRWEDEVQRLLNLTVKPRLTIVDEETTTVVTASERAELKAASARERAGS